jgi:2-dehydro-3-deoxyphosphogluconate aldolase/(4S)-4-hydroxy-2-oxoglutarate aldolase
MNPRVVQAARQAGLPFAPGVMTPSDVEQALESGCRLLKFFPAEPAGGLAYLKCMAAPYAHWDLRFIPLGGLEARHLETYLAAPIIAAVGGSWIAPRDLIRKQAWQRITDNAREATEIVQRIRKGENP